MANAGSGGATFKTDDDGTAHWPYTKLAYGADNTQTIVSTTNALPVGGTGTAGTAATTVLTVQGIASMTAIQVADNGGSLTVDGTVTIQDGGNTITVDNGGTFAVQAVCTNAGTFAVQAACTNAGTFAVQVDGGALTALQLIDNVIYVDDADWTATTSSHALVGGIYQSTPGTITDGDTGPIRLTANGAAHVSVQGTVTVGSHAVTNAGTFVVQIDGTALTRLTDIETNTDFGAVVGNGLAATALRVTMASDSTGQVVLAAGTAGIGKLTSNSGVDIGDVDILSIAAGDNNIGNVDVVTLPNVTLAAGTNTNEVVGDAAHDAAVAGNPLRVGARADTALSGITLVADGDTTDLYAGVDGVLIVRPHTGLEDVVAERTTNTDGASTAFASGLAAPGAGIRLCITSVTLCNSSASFCTVDLRDGSAGSVLWTLPVPATGGVVQSFDPPLKLSANTALAFDASAATSTLTISAQGFKTKL